MNNDIEAERKLFADAYRKKVPAYVNETDFYISIRCAPDQFAGWLMARAALAALKHEPVAFVPVHPDHGQFWAIKGGDELFETQNSALLAAFSEGLDSDEVFPLYVAPSAAPVLSDEEINDLATDYLEDHPTYNAGQRMDSVPFARALLAKVRP